MPNDVPGLFGQLTSEGGPVALSVTALIGILVGGYKAVRSWKADDRQDKLSAEADKLRKDYVDRNTALEKRIQELTDKLSEEKAKSSKLEATADLLAKEMVVIKADLIESRNERGSLDAVIDDLTLYAIKAMFQIEALKDRLPDQEKLKIMDIEPPAAVSAKKKTHSNVG